MRTRPIATLVAALMLVSSGPRAAQPDGTRPQPPQAPSSYVLIEQALAAGRIDAETAYKYRVFAAFGDGRLPAQFMGDDSAVTEPPSAVLEAGMLLRTFSPGTQAELAPYFMSPATPGSWVELRADSADSSGAADGEGMADDPATDEPGDDSGARPRAPSRATPRRVIAWHTVLAAGGRVKIWAQLQHAGDVAKADAIAREVTSTIWPALVPVIGPPKSDMGTPNSSGGPELDIFLVRPDTAAQARLAGRPGQWGGVAMFADPKECEDAAFYLLVDSRRPLGSATRGGMLQTVAHEIAHALTGAKPLRGHCAEYDWMREATATWAEHKAYPDAQSEVGWADDFLDDVSIPLPTNSPGGEYNAHGYHSYLFPLYLHLNNREAAISSIWTQFSGHDLRSGIDAGLRAVGDKLEEVFPKFAAENVNPPADGLYERRDRLTARPPIADSQDVALPPGKVDYEKPIDLDIAHLATHYTRFVFDQTVQMITFENTLVPIPHAGVHVVEKVLGSWSHPIDLTKERNKTWCRDVALEDVQELILVFTNNEWRDTYKTVQSVPGHQPTLRAYPDPCGRGWTGNHTLVNTTVSDNPAITIVETITSSIRFDVDSAFIRAGQPRRYWKSVGGSISWRVQASGTCSGSASGSVAIPNSTGDHVATLQVWTEDGKRHHWGGNGPWPGEMPMYVLTCPTASVTMPMLSTLGFFVTDAEKDDVAPDGKSFSGQFTNSPWAGLTVSHSYSFRCSQRC